MDFYAAVHSASAEEDEATRSSEQSPPPPPIAPRIPTATVSPSLSNLGSSLFSSAPGFEQSGGYYSPKRSSNDFESRSRTSSLSKPPESHRPVAQYASAPMTSIKVEDIVVQHSVNILSQADGNCLKSVELANSLRGRISGDILASVKRQYGGLLNLLEEFPSKFIVERVPKSDKVRLTHPTAPPPPPATTPTYNTSPRSYIPHHAAPPRALGEALRIHHIPNDIPDSTILSECGGSHAVQSITMDRNNSLLGGGRTATVVFRSGTDAFNAYRNLRHRGWLGTVSIADEGPHSATSSVGGLSPPSNNSTPIGSPRPYSHPPFHRSGSSSSSCGSGLTSVSNGSMLSGIAGGILSQEYRTSPAGYAFIGSGRSMSNVSVSSSSSTVTSSGTSSSPLSPHSSFVVKSSDSSHVSSLTTSSVARSSNSSPDVMYIESRLADTRISIAPPPAANSAGFSAFNSHCTTNYTTPPMTMSTPSPPLMTGPSMDVYKHAPSHVSLNHLALDKDQAAVLNVLCDALYVPSSPWKVSTSGDAYFLSLIADIMEETFGCVVIAHLKSKLKKKLRLGGSTGVRIGPLKALLKAYPCLFTIVDDKYAQLRRSAHGSSPQPGYHHQNTTAALY